METPLQSTFKQAHTYQFDVHGLRSNNQEEILFNEIWIYIYSAIFLVKEDSNTIKPTVHTSCYSVQTYSMLLLLQDIYEALQTRRKEREKIQV